MPAFRPGDVYGVTLASIYPADLVGAQPIWSDDSDASYAAFGQRLATSDTPSSQARANFADDAFAGVASTATEIILRAKFTVLSPGANGGLYLFDQALSVGGVYNQSMGFVNGWNESGPLTADDLGAPLSTLLSQPCMVFINNFTTPGGAEPYDALVHEVEVVVNTTANSYFPAPPARLSGRMDGLGPLGGPRRLDTTARSRQSRFRPGGYL